MPFFADGPAAVDRLDVPGAPGYWVELKSQATFDDDIAIQKAGVQVGTQNGGGQDGFEATGPARIQADVEAASLAYIRRMVVAWNLDGPDGNVVPVEERWVRGLPGPMGEWLLLECVKRTRKRPEEEERPFASRSQPRSRATR